jgi:SAM-dependent methyltransferase
MLSEALNRLRTFLSRRHLRFFYDHIYYSGWISRDRNFFNSGISPVDAEIRGLDFVQGEEDQAQTYYEAVKAYRRWRPAAEPRRILELGVGLGGGIPVIKAFFPESDFFGLDLSVASVRRSSRHARNALAVANCLRAPFRDGAFDLIVWVEASQALELPGLLEEPRRLLAPGGLLVIVDFRKMASGALEALLRESARQVGLAVLEYANITHRLLEARRMKSERNVRLEQRVVFPLRSVVREMTAAEGSERYAQYERGQRTYYICVLTN